MTSIGLILKGLRFKRMRSALLLLGFSVGVMVMTVLLSVGSAILDQARDTDLVGGGDIVVLPAGIDVKVMKTGGVTGMFFRIPNGRFLTRRFLTPEQCAGVTSVSPEVTGVTGRLIDGERTYPLTISGVIPSRFRLVHPDTPARFRDGPDDLAYVDPEDAALFGEIDCFHAIQSRPRDTWAEWHYFNFLDPKTGDYGYLSLSAIAEFGDGSAGDYTRGNVLFEFRRRGSAPVKVTNEVPADSITVSLVSPHVRMAGNVVTFERGAYHVRAAVVDERGRLVRADLTLQPETSRYLPPLVSPDEARTIGYTVPVVRGRLSGTIRVDGETRAVGGVGYHDHNWGFFREAVWDWGIVRAGELDILYGRFSEQPDALANEPVFVALFDERGPIALKTGASCATRWGADGEGGPRGVDIALVDGPDSLAVRIDVADFYASAFASPESPTTAPGRLFYQMEGRAAVSGRFLGRSVRAEGTGFAETFSAEPRTTRSR